MQKKTNPFTPTFGTVPLRLAGRQDIINEVLLGLEEGPGSPHRASLFIGSRGSGKTALMAKLADEATASGWISVGVTASLGMLEDIIERTEEASAHIIDHTEKNHVTSINAGGFGVTRTIGASQTGNWRTRMNRILNELSEHSVGLVITVDEVDINVDELRHLVATFQHFVVERREVVLLLAGLPKHVSLLLQDRTVSFLRRAVHHHLGLVSFPEARETIRSTIELSERTIDDAALDKATGATGGYPFLIQLIGYHMWAQNPEENEISEDDADQGILQAQKDMESRIFEVTLRELSAQDKRFLVAMTQDEDISRIGDIVKRLGISHSNAGQYRRRLITQGIIGERGWGEIGFDLPMFREFLIERGDNLSSWPYPSTWSYSIEKGSKTDPQIEFTETD